MSTPPAAAPASSASSSAPPTAEPSAGAGAVAPGRNRWRADAADLDALRSGPVLSRLDDHSVLEFDGADALTFLQGQTTADIGALDAQSWQLGGYCTPKGRLLAIFQAWRYESGVRLLLPAEIAATVARRLAMYVLRAKVRVRDASADWRAYAMVGLDSGRAALAALHAAGLQPPAAAWQALAFGATGASRLATLPCGSGCSGRWLAVVPAVDGADFERSLGLAAVGPQIYWWSQVDAAVPAVLAQTSELFVPQAVNLEVLGGVNFRKGCYPGQEIVARSQYLGKLRRRLALAHAADLGPAGDVYLDGREDPLGRIVLAASAPGGGWDLLFECPVDALQEGAVLRAGGSTAPPLQLRALPYAIVDPTA
jgi:folate-binding protein YgfZ